jgi:hypothetical protein
MLHKDSFFELEHIAEQINQTSRLVAESDFTRPQSGDWAPWIKPFEGNFPRTMPRISEWVDEARKYIDEGRGGGIGECPFEFYLTDLLDRFWTLVDGVLTPTGSEDVIFGDPMPSVFQYPFEHEHLIDAVCARIPTWSRFEDREGLWNFAMIHLGEEPVALLGMQEEGLYGGPMGWEWDSPSECEPCLFPLKTRSCIPFELLVSPAGLPILIDLTRRCITEFHDQHAYCSNCCCRTVREDLHDGQCGTCAGVVY